MFRFLRSLRAPARSAVERPNGSGRFRPCLESLEDRRVLSTVLQLQGAILPVSYAGVGFQENTVATLQAQVNGQPDTNPADFQAQINWGPATTKGDFVYTGNDSNGFADYLIKGSFTYQQGGGGVPINVTVNGPEGSTQSTTAQPSVFGMPSFIAGTPPAPVTPSAPPENVVLSLGGSITLHSTAGVAVQGAEVATLQAQVNGQPDTTLADYHVQINWGDSNGWTPGQLIFTGINGSNAEYEVVGSHVYQVNTPYSIVVYVNGPDGTSASSWSATDWVAANSQGQPLLAANFPGSGIWLYSTNGSSNSWQQLNNITAQNLSLAPDGSVYASFGAAGFWRWTQAAGWKELSPGNVQNFAVDRNDDLVVSFASFGLWRWTASGGWQQLSPGNPQSMAANDRGDVVASFGGNGLWRWTLSGGLSELSAFGPQSVAVDNVGNVVASYGAGGLWRWGVAGGWLELSTFNAQSATLDVGGDVVASFGAGGVWRWTLASGWQELSGANAQEVAVDFVGDVVANFGAGGLWRWTPSGGWKELTTTPLQSFVVDDSGNVVVNFIRGGLWRWASPFWNQISFASTTGLAVP